MHGQILNSAQWSQTYQRNNKGGGLKNLRCFPTCKAVHVERGYCGAPVYFSLVAPGPSNGAAMEGMQTTLEDPSDYYIFARFTLAKTCRQRSEGVTKSPSKASTTGTTLDEQSTEQEGSTVADDNEEGSVSSSSHHSETAVDFEEWLASNETVKVSQLEEMKTKEERRAPKSMYIGEHCSTERMAGNFQEMVFVFNRTNKGWNYAWHGTKHTSLNRHCLRFYIFKKTPEDKSEAKLALSVDSPDFSIYSRKKSKQMLQKLHDRLRMEDAGLSPSAKRMKVDDATAARINMLNGMMPMMPNAFQQNDNQQVVNAQMLQVLQYFQMYQQQQQQQMLQQQQQRQQQQAQQYLQFMQMIANVNQNNTSANNNSNPVGAMMSSLLANMTNMSQGSASNQMATNNQNNGIDLSLLSSMMMKQEQQTPTSNGAFTSFNPINSLVCPQTPTGNENNNGIATDTTEENINVSHNISDSLRKLTELAEASTQNTSR